jgi:hypothetical protein
MLRTRLMLASILIGAIPLMATAQTVKTRPAPAAERTATPPTAPSNALTSATMDALLSNPAKWHAVDWSKPHFLNDARWLPRLEPETGSKGDVLTHERETSAFGIEKMKLRRWQASSLDAEVMLSMSTKVPRSACINSAIAFGNELGQALASNDSSRFYFSETSFIELMNLSWQWTIGTTRVKANCLGVTGSSADKMDEVNLALVFEPTARSAELKPAFLLRCTRSLRLASDEETRPLDDFVFWVSQNPSPKIRSPRLLVIHERDLVAVDDLQISFTIKNSDAMISRYVIDRVTGQLSGEVIEQSKFFGKLSGACSKIDSAAKF